MGGTNHCVQSTQRGFDLSRNTISKCVCQVCMFQSGHQIDSVVAASDIKHSCAVFSGLSQHRQLLHTLGCKCLRTSVLLVSSVEVRSLINRDHPQSFIWDKYLPDHPNDTLLIPAIFTGAPTCTAQSNEGLDLMQPMLRES